MEESAGLFKSYSLFHAMETSVPTDSPVASNTAPSALPTSYVDGKDRKEWQNIHMHSMTGNRKDGSVSRD